MARVAALLILLTSISILTILINQGCDGDNAPEAPGEGRSSPAPVDARAELAARGRLIYMSTCIACHNGDPHRAGPLGPEIAGAPRELVASKVLRNEYPAGYRPKRETRAMVPLPHLEPEIDALVAFLAEAPAS